MTADGSDSGQLLSVTPPLVNPEPFLLSQKTQLYTDVTEVPPQSSPAAFTMTVRPLQSDVDIFWDVDSLIAENGLHSRSRWGKESKPPTRLSHNIQRPRMLSEFY